MDFMIWQVMPGSGVRTGMERTIIVGHQLTIRQGQRLVQCEYCEAVPGLMLHQTACGPLIASTAYRVLGIP